ncbi:acyl-CoA 6-desaturase-like [Dysidea avara]|uniref:acyl-CoA 6-desaturase-like n=1 Tax=Dysidea avara TaxID=196820 RepID=UPI003333DD6B
MAPNTPNGALLRRRGVGDQVLYTREEVAQHRKPGDSWVILHGEVYNVTNWLPRHPGGSKVLGHYGGQDATVAFESFHIDKDYVRKYLKPLHIGSLLASEKELTPVSREFLELRKQFEKEKLFTPSVTFFTIYLLHIILFEVAAWVVLKYWGIGWVPYIMAAILLATGQAQAGWLQHDFGHLSVFKKSWMNHLAHHVVQEGLKGASCYWWNIRHFQHHAKPNVFLKDPDVSIPLLFLVGKIIPEKWGKRKWGIMPYRFQHNYFFLMGPPLLIPIYFHLEVVYYLIKNGQWVDVVWDLLYYLRFHLLFAPLTGGFWANFVFYFFMRFLESHWFVWVTQSNHIPMEVNLDQKEGWVEMQLRGTRNTDSSFFWDWFTGHLNHQIEHHLFPTMPRHNYYKAAPRVRELCAKYGIEYQLKNTWEAFGDIVRSLRDSGEIYYHAYHES